MLLSTSTTNPSSYRHLTSSHKLYCPGLSIDLRAIGHGAFQPSLATIALQSQGESTVTSLSIGVGLLAAVVLVFWMCLPRHGMVAPIIQSINRQTIAGLFVTGGLAIGILMILHGIFE